MKPVSDPELLKQLEGAKPVTDPAVLAQLNGGQEYDPTADMSGYEKFMAGVGKAFYDIGRGTGQMLGLVDQKDIDQAKKEDAALMRTGLGTAGNITGNLAAALPAAFIPGANGYVGSTLVGSALGAIQPVATGESRLKNTAVGGAFGLGGNVAGRALVAGGKGVKAMVDPFRAKGQNLIAGRTLNRFAGNADDAVANLSQAKQLVSGSVPTAGEAAKDAGIAQLQRGLQTSDPALAAQLAERGLEQNAARIAALQSVSGTADDLSSAIGRRSSIADKAYGKAFGQTVRVNDALKELTNRPSIKSAVDRAAQIAAEDGVPLNNLFDQNGKLASVRGLHYVKMALDDMLDSAPTSGIGKSQQRAIANTRDELLKWIDDASPAYKSARVRFERASRPINRMQVGQEIEKRVTGSQLQNAMGDFTITPAAFGRAMKADKSLVRSAIGGKKSLDQVMTPKQMEALTGIRDDLARSNIARDFGRSVGSNTAQNLASQNLLRQVLGPTGLPQSWAENTLLQTLMRPAQFGAKIGEQRIQERLAQAMLDPKLAAELMRGAKIQPGLLNRLPSPVSVGGLLAPSIYAAQE